MAPISLTPLEDLLLGHIERQLGLGEERIRETPFFRMALREVLYDTRLSPEEDAVRRQGEGKAEGEILRELIAARVQRALDALSEDCAHLYDTDAPARGSRIALPAGELERLPPASDVERVLRGCLAKGPLTATVPEGLDSLFSRALGAAAAVAGEAEAGGLAPGELLGGKYRILRRIGRGGFGAVYEARDESLDRLVAIKHVSPEGARRSRGGLSLKEEARRIAKLSHPNIVDWKFFDEREDGSYYFVMELLGGEDLEATMAREGRLPPRRAARILLQVLDALRSAHCLEGGGCVLHLDLKPKNVVLLPGRPFGDGERVKVIDFGIGQYIGGPEDTRTATVLRETVAAETVAREAASVHPSAPALEARSTPRCSACTPEYASPEQCRHIYTSEPAEPLDGRSDIYSLGVMGFQMLGGALPFEDPPRRDDYARLHRSAEPRSLASLGVEIPQPLARFIERCLRKDRAERWESADAAYRELKRIAEALPEVSPEAAPLPEPRLCIVPEPMRAEEGVLLRAEVHGLPEGAPLRLEARCEPGGGACFLGPGAVYEGPAPGPAPICFQLHALAPGALRIAVEACALGQRSLGTLEAAVLPPATLRFAGRAKETRRIAQWFDAPGSGLLLVRGESGVGKSRLAAEAAIDAARRGAAILFGRGRKTFRSPLQPFRQVALALLHQAEAEADRPGGFDLLEALLQDRLSGEGYIAEYFTAFLHAGSISAEQKSMLPYYWLRLLHRTAGERPILVVLDDLQWADAETVSLLLGLLSLAHQRKAQLKVLAAVQPFGLAAEEAETVSALETAVRDLQADKVPAVTLDLRPLEAADLDSLLDSFFPGNAFRRDVPWIYERLRRKTGGNPLFAEWVLKRLACEPGAAGRAIDGEGARWQPSLALTPERFDDFVPEEIESVLDQRLAGLPVKALEVCQMAAAIGDPFDLRLLEKLLGDSGALDETLPFLEEQEIVKPSKDPALYQFAHSVVLHRLYRKLVGRSRWRAARLHGKIAGAMASVYTPRELEEHALVHAHHLISADRRQEGLVLLLRGGGRLLEQQLYASALPQLERARALVEGGVEIDGPDLALLHLRLGKAYGILGRLDDSMASLEAARRTEEGASGALGMSVELARGSILVHRGRLEEAEQIFRSALRADLPDNQLQAASALTGLAAVKRLRGQLEEALRDHLLAMGLREKAGADTEVANSCVNIGNTFCDQGQYEEAERAYRRAIPIFEARGLKNYLIYALSGLGNVLFRSDPAQAARYYERAMRLCQETGNRVQLSVLYYNLGEVSLVEHRYSEALRGLELSLALMERVGRRAGEAAARSRKAEVHCLLGEHEEASRELERARDLARSLGSRLELVTAVVQGARLARARGDAEGARRSLEEALALSPEGVDVYQRLLCAQGLVELGDRGRARALLEEAARAPSLASEPDAACLLEHLRGLSSDEPAERRARLEKALAIASERYAELPRLLSDLAVLVEPERSRELHTRAVAVLRQRAEGIDGEAARRRFLLENRAHQEIAARARAAGVAVSL
ncbi:MAG: tetratricopeptide repeat protein [Planctomycetes bacterium]|nr:tetratricopeptide repeat protein [Planctomycetota bacterium]